MMILVRMTDVSTNGMLAVEMVVPMVMVMPVMMMAVMLVNRNLRQPMVMFARYAHMLAMMRGSVVFVTEPRMNMRDVPEMLVMALGHMIAVHSGMMPV